VYTPGSSAPPPAERFSAQGLVEYALIIAIVSLIAIGGLIVMWPALSALYSGMGHSV
jgi:hypothetical protein